MGKILFLARDQGSMQTLLPVIREVQWRTGRAPSVVVAEVSARLMESQSIPFYLLDDAAFSASPELCIGAILEKESPVLVVSGSSPARGIPPETPEQYLIPLARNRGIQSIAILDYWGMYAERFLSPAGRIDLNLVPDRLCVLDRRCFEDLTALGVPQERLVITHNPWMDQVVAAAAVPPPCPLSFEAGGLRVLFVSQPYEETRDARGWSFTQRDLFQTMRAALPPCGSGRRHTLLIWPHPAERSDQWRDIVGEQDARTDTVVSLVSERGASVLAHIDLVISGHSTVAYEALHLGTPTVSFRPGECRLGLQMAEELGLIPLFDNKEALRIFLANFDAKQARADLSRSRDKYVGQGLFFSDGNATNRVLGEIDELLSS